MHTVIVANSPELDITPFLERVRRADLVIAADGGALPLLRAGIVPRIAIGDMDSVDAASLDILAERGADVRRFPRAKDETDLELALLAACEAGAASIDIVGALGGRWDHTLANVALLALPELRERRVRLLADDQTLYLVRDTAQIDGKVGDTVSLIPLAGNAHGVTTEGLQYVLRDATLALERARGISNVLLDPPGRVSLREGLLLVVHHDDGGAHQFWHQTPEHTD